MMSLEFTNQIPFKDVYVTGLIRDENGQKMSKSKGNVIDPLDLIYGISQDDLVEKRTANLMQEKIAEKIERKTRNQFPKGIDSYGTDALRMTFYSLATHTKDISFELGRLKGYRNFCTKIWNAARFINNYPIGNESFKPKTDKDKWIKSEFDKTKDQIQKNIEDYRLDYAINEVYEFFWGKFCDVYIEDCKKSGETDNLRPMLKDILVMMHPFAPFITEEIHSLLFDSPIIRWNKAAMAIIKASDLVKKYINPKDKSKIFNAVDGVSLSINSGEIFGILGPNGAGKTTTLEMLEGLKDIDEGLASINSIDVTSNPYEIKKLIGVQLQANEYFDNMTLVELLKLFLALYNSSNDPLDLLKKVKLEDKANANANELSGGQKQRFSIASALVNNPLVLFLDEPTTGLDPQAKRNIWDLVLELNRTGMTIVLTTHNMEEAEFLCHRIAIMDHGKIIAEDSPKDLIMKHAPNKIREIKYGNMEDVFIALTGHGLRD